MAAKTVAVTVASQCRYALPLRCPRDRNNPAADSTLQSHKEAMMKTITIRLACLATFAGLMSCTDIPTGPAALRNSASARANVRKFPAALASSGWLEVGRTLVASHKL